MAAAPKPKARSNSHDDAVPGLAARRIAADIVDGVLRRNRALDEQFDGATANAGLAALAERDRALTRALVATVLRRLGTLRHLIGIFLERGAPAKAPQVDAALLIGAAQILFLDVPDHAAVDLSVRVVRGDRHAAHYAGLVNAVLRRIAREGPERLGGLDTAVLDTPEWLMARWVKTYGEATARDIAMANGREPALDLTVKSDPDLWAERLGGRVLPTGLGARDRARLDNRPAGFCRRRVVGSGRGGGFAGAAVRRRRGASHRRSVRGARRQDRAACRSGRPRHCGRSLAGAPRSAAGKPEPPVARSRAGLRGCARMDGRAVRCRSDRRAVLIDGHHSPPPRHTVAQAPSRHHKARRVAAAPDRACRRR